MKPCPYCAEQIPDDAKKCPRCGEFLDPALRQASPEAAATVNQALIAKAKKDAGRALTYGIVGILIFGIILGPAAIVIGGNANKKLKELGQPPDGRATAGRIIGIVVTVLWAIGILVRLSGS